MVTVTVNAMSMAKYFVAYLMNSGDPSTTFLIPIKDFDYYPIHYGLIYEIDRFDAYLINKENYDDTENHRTFASLDLFDDIDIFTFEFDTEEEAMYFKLKFCCTTCSSLN